MANENRITVEILYGSFSDHSWQKKSFKNMTSAIEWIRKNYEKIGCINEYRTDFMPVNHFDIVNAILGERK